MKRLLLVCVLLLTCSAFGQYMRIGSVFPTGATAAATPTFSPAAGAVSNPTTVTASTVTVDGCTMYLDTNNPPTTAQSTYSVTTGVTLYAQAKGCSTHSNSAVASAAYTITCTSGACSDNFSGTAGTLLATYNPQWSDSTSSNLAHLVLVSGGGVYPTANIASSAFYSASTSLTSTVAINPGKPSTASVGPAVLVSSGVVGYTAFAGNTTSSIYIHKNGAGIAGSTNALNPYANGVPFCLQIKAVVTSTVVLTTYTAPYSGGACGSFTLLSATATDSSSIITTGNAGISWSSPGASNAAATVYLWKDN